jgi:hypothetical protein
MGLEVDAAFLPCLRGKWEGGEPALQSDVQRVGVGSKVPRASIARTPSHTCAKKRATPTSQPVVDRLMGEHLMVVCCVRSRRKKMDRGVQIPGKSNNGHTVGSRRP